MNRFRKLLSVAAIASGTMFGACENVLNILPPLDLPAESALTTTNGLEAATIGCYSTTGGMADGSLMVGNAVRVGEVWADNVIATNPGFGEQQIVSFQLNFFNDQGRAIWENGYRLINRVNAILEAIDANKVTDAAYAANKDRIRGEVLLVRGWTQFDLVRHFAQAWGFTADNGHPGIVLRDKSTTGRPGTEKARATVKESYDRIIADLQTAEGLLPASNPKGTGRANKATAAALLARVYFQQNDFAKAAEAASRVISTNNYSLTPDPRAPFDNNSTPEAVFEFASTTQQDASGALFGSYNQKDNEPPYLLDAASPVVAALFPATGTSPDKRATCFVKRDGQFYVAKYDRTPMNIPSIRYAEILLIRAESLAASSTTQALADVNVVRQRAGLPALTGLSGAALATAIQRERLIELAAEGDRFHELKRLKQNIRSRAWNNSQVIFKLPDTEVGTNKLVTQNPD